MFHLLGRLDHAFASLLQGRDLDTGESLPGFETGYSVSNTEKVRLKSIVDRTRLCAAEVIGEGGWDDELDRHDGVYGSVDDERNDNHNGNEYEDIMDEDPAWERELALVYDKTIVELGDTLAGSPIGLSG